MTVEEACEAYLRELNARNIRKSSRASYRTLFRQLQAFALESGIEAIRDIDRAAICRWRERWECAHSTQSQRLKLLKAFFSHARTAGWIPESPLKGIRGPKLDSKPTLPLNTDEVRALLRAAERQPREQAMLLLLRYSGVSIQDASLLRRDAVQAGGDLVLRRAKSGELVMVTLPDEVLAALDAVAEPGSPHYFWTGRSEPATPPKYWRKRLQRIADEAGVKGFHPHRLRDTFAVELLLAGVLIQDVATLLGHSSVATTERHYAPWNLARRERLSRIVREVHQRDPILLEFTPKKPAGAVPAAPAEADLATNHVPRAARLAYAQSST